MTASSRLSLPHQNPGAPSPRFWDVGNHEPQSSRSPRPTPGCPIQVPLGWVLLLLVLVLLLVCLALPTQAQSSGYRIAGRVIDGVTGEPLQRVTVTVLGDQYNQLVASTVSDAEGHFDFEHIPAGKYPLSAARRGYRTSYYDEHDSFNSAIVTGPDQDTAHLIFRLDPGAVLHGVITDDGGDPVESAQVMLFRRGDGGRMEQAGNGSTQSDETGAYEFNNLQPGEYWIAVKADPWYAQHDARPGPGGQQSPLDVAYPITYYDSTTDEASATSVTLAAGSHEEADINLHAVPALRFRLPAPPNPARRPYLAAEQKVFGNVINSERMENGDPNSSALEISGVAPGNYDLEYGDPPRRITVNATSNVDVDAAAGTPTITVSGKLAMAGGGPPPDDVDLVLDAPDQEQPAAQTMARKGEFEFTSVPPGTWSVKASDPREPLAVVAVSSSGQLTAGDKFVLRDRPASLVVTISRALTTIKGFARADGKAAPGAMIVLVPREPGAYPALVRRDQSDSDGSFALREVPAGQYTVIAIQDGWKLDWQKRETIAPYLAHGVAVTVGNQSGADVSLAQPVPAVPR